MDGRNPYEVLGIGPEATQAEIKSAFHREALRWHPDRNPDDPSAEARFKAASEAYEVLRGSKDRNVHGHGFRGDTGIPGFDLGYGRGCGRGRGRGCGRRFRREPWVGGWGGSIPYHLVDIRLSPAEAMAGCEKRITFESLFGGTILAVQLPPKLEDGTVIRLDKPTRGSASGFGEAVYLRINVEPTTR
jgi:molecular chaperone DnaJ